MAAIMLERKKPGEQGARWNGQQQGCPIGMGCYPEHEGDKGCKWNCGCNQLNCGTPVIGVAVEIAMGRQLLGLLA